MIQLYLCTKEHTVLAWLAQQDANGDGSDDDNSDDDQEVNHIVPFKCIGAAHENDYYQHHLEQAYIAFQQNTLEKVQLKAGPLNPFDPRAIAIDLDYGTGWCHVEYIASEL